MGPDRELDITEEAISSGMAGIIVQNVIRPAEAEEAALFAPGSGKVRGTLVHKAQLGREMQVDDAIFVLQEWTSGEFTILMLDSRTAESTKTDSPPLMVGLMIGIDGQLCNLESLFDARQIAILEELHQRLQTVTD